MLLDEDPATLIHHTIGNFNIHPDKTAISRIHDSLSTLHQARDLRIREAEASLKKLARTQTTLATQHADAINAHDISAAHAPSIVELDTRKFRLAKAASDLEVEAERLAGEAEVARVRLAELEAQGVEGAAMERGKREGEDPVVLRLKIYRLLGIDVEPDEAGNYNKAIVRNGLKNDVHVVKIDPKFSRFFYANYFWKTM